MKRSILLTLALCLSPTLAYAQTSLAAPDAPMPPATADTAAGSGRFAEMQQMHQQMQEVHREARVQILAALSPQHRTMIANIVGGLTVASNPDPAGAARQIDAILSPGEKQSVLNIHATTRASLRNMLQAQRGQAEAAATADERARMQQRDAQRQAAEQAHMVSQDAGSVVLHMLGHFSGPGVGMHRP